jgi:hypothetical protein
MSDTPKLSKAEIKLLLRIRQLRKQPPAVVKLNTYPLQVNVRGSWEVLENTYTSGSVAY